MNDYKEQIIRMIEEMEDVNYLEKIFYYIRAKYLRSKKGGAC